MNKVKVLADIFGLKSEGDSVCGFKLGKTFPKHPKLDHVQPVMVIRSQEGDYLLSESEPAEVALYIYHRPETNDPVMKIYSFVSARDAIVALSLDSFIAAVFWDALEHIPFKDAELIINEYIVLPKRVEESKDELDLTMCQYSDLTLRIASAQAK